MLHAALMKFQYEENSFYFNLPPKNLGFFFQIFTQNLFTSTPPYPLKQLQEGKELGGNPNQPAFSAQSPREKEELCLTHITEESRRAKDVCAM